MATITCLLAKSALLGASRQGHNTEALLQASGINPELLGIPFARVDEAQMTRLVQNIWELLDDEFMGFTETPCKPGAFAFMLHSIRRCDSLREALEQGTRFYNLLTHDITTELLERDRQAHIIIRFRNPNRDPDHFYLQFWMIIWHRLASWISGTKIVLQYTSFDHAAPANSEELHYMFPGELRFQQRSNQLCFSADYLNAPLIRDKQEIKAFLQHSPYDLLTIPGTDTSLKNQIRHRVFEQSSEQLCFPGIEEMADSLNLTPSTLHRHLRKEGSSYQKIKDEIRRDLALHKLIKEKLPVHQVAEQLGFTEARSFTRAFKQWTGLSPREYCRYL